MYQRFIYRDESLPIAVQQGDCLLLRTQILPLEKNETLDFDDMKILPLDRDFYDSSTHKAAQTVSRGNPWM